MPWPCHGLPLHHAGLHCRWPPVQGPTDRKEAVINDQAAARAARCKGEDDGTSKWQPRPHTTPRVLVLSKSAARCSKPIHPSVCSPHQRLTGVLNFPGSWVMSRGNIALHDLVWRSSREREREIWFGGHGLHASSRLARVVGRAAVACVS